MLIRPQTHCRLAPEEMRFMFYSHDGLGVGHTRRHLAVAAALAEQAPGASILLATGAEDIAGHGLPRQVEILKLPGLRKDGNEMYSSRRLRLSGEEIRSLRSALLLVAIKKFQPEVVLVDKHPFGASGEFKSGLKALRRQRGRAVLGLRDILDEQAQVLKEWSPFRMLENISEYYDQVLIYGEKAVFDLVSEYDFPSELAERTQFCGYVLGHAGKRALENCPWPFAPRAGRARPVVLATTGGGEDGFRILEAFIRAAAGAPWQGVAVAGPMIRDAELDRLEKLAREHAVELRSFVPHLSAWFPYLDALVCMGGYNTLVESAAACVPTVCVPRVKPRREQLIRAEAFARLGLLEVCRPSHVEPAALREKIGAVLSRNASHQPVSKRHKLRLDGAHLAAQCLLALTRASASIAPH